MKGVAILDEVQDGGEEKEWMDWKLEVEVETAVKPSEQLDVLHFSL